MTRLVFHLFQRPVQKAHQVTATGKTLPSIHFLLVLAPAHCKVVPVAASERKLTSKTNFLKTRLRLRLLHLHLLRPTTNHTHSLHEVSLAKKSKCNRSYPCPPVHLQPRPVLPPVNLLLRPASQMP